MARVILTDNPGDLGSRASAARTCAAQVDCACDCDCACPVDGAAPLPVLDLPVAYYLELTPNCNNRCPGCGNVYAVQRGARARPSSPSPSDRFGRPGEGWGGGPATSPLDGAAWQALIAGLASHAHHLKLTGGEPTLHPEFPTILRAIEQAGLSFALFTNGRWPDPLATIQPLRQTPACDGLLVSLHGPDAETHETFSGVPGSFAETADNVRRATDAGLEAAISLVITRHNWDRIAETLALALDLGANHVVCNRWIGASGLDIAPHEAQLRAAITTVERLRRASAPIRYGNCIPHCFNASSSAGCTAGRTFATIDPWGRLRPCNHAPLVAGDLRPTSTEASTEASIKAAWHGPVMTYWRTLVPAACTGCAAYAICHGGCRAQALLSDTVYDPLFREALQAPTPVPEPALSLYKGLRPVGQYAYRREQGRDVLIHKSQVAVVPAALSGRWPRLDGTLTLQEIQTLYGTELLAWVGQCSRQEIVTWQGNL